MEVTSTMIVGRECFGLVSTIHRATTRSPTMASMPRRCIHHFRLANEGCGCVALEADALGAIDIH
jgi:hypothetical protein